MFKNNMYKILIIALAVSLSFNAVFVVLNVIHKNDLRREVNFFDTKFSEADFPLEIDLLTTVFNVGDNVSGTVTITNKSGRAVEVSSNGYTPCVYLHNITTENNHPDMDDIHFTVLKAGDKMTTVFSQKVDEAGTYILHSHYNIRVNRCTGLFSQLEDVIIEVR